MQGRSSSAYSGGEVRRTHRCGSRSRLQREVRAIPPSPPPPQAARAKACKRQAARMINGRFMTVSCARYAAWNSLLVDRQISQCRWRATRSDSAPLRPNSITTVRFGPPNPDIDMMPNHLERTDHRQRVRAVRSRSVSLVRWASRVEQSWSGGATCTSMALVIAV
jgi:hypothetical protein